MVVAGALLALLVQMFVLILVPMARASGHSADRVELHNMVAAALDKLFADLDRGSPDSITLRTAPVVAAVQPLAELTADGRPSWERELVVYALDTVGKRLVRRVWPPAPPSFAWELTPARAARIKPEELQLLGEPGSATQTVLASWVRSFQVTLAGSQLDAALEVERGNQRYGLSLSRYLHNH